MDWRFHGLRERAALLLAPWLRPTWTAQLSDSRFSECYIDRDLSRWGPNLTATTSADGRVHVVWSRPHETG